MPPAPPCRCARAPWSRCRPRKCWRWAPWAQCPPASAWSKGAPTPYPPAALKQRDANKADWIHKDPEIKCYLPGVPRANYMALPFQIFQSESATLIAYEYAGAVRNLQFKDPGPAPVDSWMGQSVAHWEGDSLVVVVTGMLDSTWFDR